MFGNEIIVNSDDRIEYGFKVESVKSNGVVLEVEYKNRTHVSDNQQVQARPDFSSLIGEKVGLFLSSTGWMSDFNNFDDLPEIEVPDQGMTLDENRYILEIQQLLPILADHPIGIGDVWTAVQEFEEPLPAGSAEVVVTTKYTVLEETQKDEIACLKIAGEISATVTGSGELQAMPFDLKMTGAGKSVVYFAYKKGMLLEVVEDLRIKGEAVMNEEDVDMTLPMDHTFHTGIEAKI